MWRRQKKGDDKTKPQAVGRFVPVDCKLPWKVRSGKLFYLEGKTVGKCLLTYLFMRV